MNAIPILPLSSLQWVGQGLVRPACVLALADGGLLTSDWRGGVCAVAPDGQQRLITATLPDGRPLRPNGIALTPDGRLSLAQLGE